MDRVFDVISTSLLNHSPLTEIVSSRIFMGHIATLGEPVSPLVTMQFDIRGEVIVPGAISRPTVQISAWSEVSFSEAGKILRIVERHFIDSMAIQNDDLNVTLAIRSTAVFDSFSEGESEPRSYRGIQAYDLGVGFK